MSYPLSIKAIQQLCNQTIYERGLEYVEAERVEWSYFEQQYHQFEATVYGKRQEFVTIDLTDRATITATCFCSLQREEACEHIVAALLSLYAILHHVDLIAEIVLNENRDVEHLLDLAEPSVNKQQVQADKQLAPTKQTQKLPVANQYETANLLLQLVKQQQQPPAATQYIHDVRTELSIAYHLKLAASPETDGQPVILLELFVGTTPDALYPVAQPGMFLFKITKKATYVCHSQFIYHPAKHRFSTADYAILQPLIQYIQQDKLYTSHINSARGNKQATLKLNEQALFIPPLLWEQLLPFLLKHHQVHIIDTTSQLANRSIRYERLTYFQQPLPLTVHFFDDAITEQYGLQITGLSNITLLPAYQLAYADRTLLAIDETEADLLFQLQSIAKQQDQLDSFRLIIHAEQMSHYLDAVFPIFKKIATVTIDETITDKVVTYPLQARFYIDRVKDRLLVSLEFQYGDITINPLQEPTMERGYEHILQTDRIKEEKIMALMTYDSFFRTESGFVVDDEEAQFHLLYEVIPQMEQLAEILATAAVKIKLHHEQLHPIMHIHFDERHDWLEFRLDIEGFDEEEIKQLVRAIRLKQRYFKIKSGALVPLSDEQFERIITLMNEVGLHQVAWDGVHGHLPAIKALSLLQFPDDIGQSFKLNPALRKRLAHLQQPDKLNFPIPPMMEPLLRNYQKYGYQWMRTLAYYRVGGILADDMGLGKTIQSITFLAAMLDEIRTLDKAGTKQAALIIAPASLTYNWWQEIQKFAPHIKACVVDGSLTKRKKIIANQEQMDVLITSYPLMRQDSKVYEKYQFHTLLLDEAQFVKNEATRTSVAIKAVRAKHIFALTGTPIENRLQDLFSIFQIVLPELFDNRDILKYYPEQLVARRIAPFILRRTKNDVLKELPPKIEVTYSSELLPEQKKLYVAYLAKLRKETLKHLDDHRFNKEKLRVLAGITRLRQLCCHPALFVDGYEGGSAKLRQLFDIIEECQSSGKRMLIFSQFTSMLQIIAKELGYQAIPYFYLDGATEAAERVALCERFNAGEKDIFLISLKAGGTGLNLTGADTVVLYDPWWNPAVEQQAADRAHRLGQQKVVQVIKLIAKGTLEEKMLQLQQRKKDIIDAVIQPELHQTSALATEDLLELLAIEIE
ncbi:SNF2 helicase associated domain-containing protein [Paenibacillus yanchengensis]|uniref:SNF2 helicase associated domain-containing protein n=1 Tax=Paenibacillus yanchengensis TaxID=2035833 RepID=A0ABW4YM99_9BACL